MQPPESPSQQLDTYAVPVPAFVGAVLVLVLACFCGLGTIGAIPSLRGLTSSPATVTVTASFTASPVWHPFPYGGTLGSPLGDFVQRYGTAIDDSGLRYATTLADRRVLIVVQVDNPHQSGDGQMRVIAIDVQVPEDALGDESWDAATANAIAQTFVPANAHYERSFTAQGVMASFYFSDVLAGTFVYSQFPNDSGILNYSCHPWPPAVTPAASGTGDSHGGVYRQCHIGMGNE